MRKRLGGWDYAGMLAGFALPLIITCVLARHRVFWEDEMLGWMLLRDPSWRHMLLAYNQGADGGGFSFYLLGRGWFALFGHSEQAFRLFSATCFGLAFVVTWAALRRFYGVGVVTFALFNTWFFSPPFVAHMAEGRFYGLLVLGVSMAFGLVPVLEEVRRPTARRWYAIMFLVHGLLATSHLLGVVFSAFAIAALLAADLMAERLRPGLYLAGIASWLLLIPERANIVASARVGKPWFWTKAPRPVEVIAVFTGSSKEIALVLVCLLALVLWGFLRLGAGRNAAWRRVWEARRPVYAVVAAMVALGLGFLVEGTLGTWLFNDRYLLPMTVAITYATAELTQLTVAAMRTTPVWPLLSLPLFRFTAAAGFWLILLSWDFHHLRHFSMAPEDYTAELTAKLPHGMPVVVEDGFSFTELIGKQHGSGVDYVFLLDWPQTVSAWAPRVEVTQYHLMENWRRVGYFSGSILSAEEFLREHREFLVVHAEPWPPTGLPPDIGNPLAERLAKTPGYEVRPYAELRRYKMRDTVWLVCRGGCGAGL